MAAAFCIWLTVRVVNRRERWAKRVAVIAATGLAYPLSFWVACWAVQHGMLTDRIAKAVYEPIFWMEFHAAQPLQEAALSCAKSFGVKATYVGLRDAPFSRTYPVGDFAFRQNDGCRVFEASPWLLLWITTSIEPDSWEELAGPGSMYASPRGKALIVLQSRRVHAAIAAFLDKIRSVRQSAAHGRDLDCEGLGHALFGFYSEPKLRPGCICINENRDGDRLVIDGASFANFDELMAFLQLRRRDSLRSGIFWSEWRREPNPSEIDRLKGFCQMRDLDLFIRPNYGSIIGQPVERQWWIVRASDSIYLDPE
ncbi:MAG TPA: hypothetical protein VKU82_11650 [Planctomycetaceae bacterium]|nr:hypothetical protein [Planctomycetaceae bacterium]